MANPIVDRYTTNTSSFLFDGYNTFIPAVRPPFLPDNAIVVASTGTVTLNNGEIVITASNAVGAKVMTIPIRRIDKDSVKGITARTEAAQVVTITIGAIDTVANPKGIQSIRVNYSGNREIEPFYDHEYQQVSDPALALTTAQRASDLVKRINADPNRKFNAAIPSGGGANNSKVQLTAIQAGKNYVVTLGYPTMTMVETPAVTEFGTGKWLASAYGGLDASAYADGTTYRTVLLVATVRSANLNYGLEVGGRAGTFQHANEDRGYAILFATGTTTQETALTDILKGDFATAKEYYAVVDAITFA